MKYDRGVPRQQRVSGVRGEIASEPPPDQSENGFESLSRDEVFEILCNQRRRFAIHHLERNGDNATLGDLADHIAAWENDIDKAAVSSAERKRVYTSLQQFHLPKLDEKDVVDFDERAGTVELGDAASEVDIYLEVVAGNDIPWSQFYLGLATGTFGLAVAVLAGISPLTVLAPVAWLMFVATTFLVLAGLHTYVTGTEMRLGDDTKPPEVT